MKQNNNQKSMYVIRPNHVTVAFTGNKSCNVFDCLLFREDLDYFPLCKKLAGHRKRIGMLICDILFSI